MVDKKREWPAQQHPSSRRHDFSFFQKIHGTCTRQVRSEELFGIHIRTCAQKIIHGQLIVPLCPSWVIPCRSATESIPPCQPGTERLPSRYPHHFRAPLPRARAPWPLNVLTSYYPFENPPFPILQRFSRELFHFPSQIRTR